MRDAPMHMKLSWLDWAIVLIAAILATWAVALSNPVMNPDGIAYVRITTYYARGDFDLALSAYWGPLISWLAAPIYWVTGDAIMSIRTIMAASAALLVLGTMRLARIVGLGAIERVAVGAVATVFAIRWVVYPITPDLMLAAITTLGTAEILDHRGGITRRPVIAGMVMGLAYLTKTVGLPMSIGVIVAINGWRALTLVAPIRAVAGSTLASLAVVVAMAAPWIVTLSLHYEEFTWSSAGDINYLYTNPKFALVKKIRGSPWFGIYHQPEAGRLLSWEDPRLSIFDALNIDLTKLKRSLQEILVDEWNKLPITSKRIYDVTSNMTFRGFGLIVLISNIILCWPWPSELRNKPWRLLMLPAFIMLGIYLPFYIRAERYFIGILPPMLVGFVAMTSHYGQWAFRVGGLRPGLGRVLLALVLVVVLLGYVKASEYGRHTSRAVREPGYGKHSDYTLARNLATDFRDRINGPIAAALFDDSELERFRNTAAFLSFLLEQPFHGREVVGLDVDRILESNADFILVVAATPLAGRLEQDHRFRELRLDRDTTDSENTSTYPIVIYEIVKTD